MSRADRMIRAQAAAVVVAIGVVAAVVSFRHALEVVRAHGETGVTVYLSPLTIDGLVYVASMVMLDSARRGQRPPGLAKWALGLGIGATVAVNVLHGIAHGPVGAVIAAWPAVCLVLVVELLMGMIRRGRAAGFEGAVDQVADIEDGLAEVAAGLAAEQVPGLVLDRPDQGLPVLVAAGSTAPADLVEAVISARLAGRSERDVAKAFGVSRYRVKKLTAAHSQPPRPRPTVTPSTKPPR